MAVQSVALTPVRRLTRRDILITVRDIQNPLESMQSTIRSATLIGYPELARSIASIRIA